jgi:hypothetical protein
MGKATGSAGGGKYGGGDEMDCEKTSLGGSMKSKAVARPEARRKQIGGRAPAPTSSMTLHEARTMTGLCDFTTEYAFQCFTEAARTNGVITKAEFDGSFRNLMVRVS